MVVDVTRRDFTLESAYYDCIIEMHDAISNNMITMLIESTGLESINEGAKETFSRIINAIITALRNLKDKIVSKFKEIKAKIKGDKEASNKADEAIEKVEDAFETKKSEFESLKFDTSDLEAEKEKLQEKADKAAKAINDVGAFGFKNISSFYPGNGGSLNDLTHPYGNTISSAINNAMDKTKNDLERERAERAAANSMRMHQTPNAKSGGFSPIIVI